MNFFEINKFLSLFTGGNSLDVQALRWIHWQDWSLIFVDMLLSPSVSEFPLLPLSLLCAACDGRLLPRFSLGACQ